MKFDSSDILKIMRLFFRIDDRVFARDIKSIKKSKPHETNALIQFVFQKEEYAILIDNLAEDDPESLYFQLEQGGLTKDYKLFANPDGEKLTTYAVPYKGKDCYLFKKSREVERLDLILSKKYPEYSRNYLARQIKLGNVYIDSEIAKKPSQIVKTDSSVELKIEDTAEISQPEIDVIYEDENVLVINKPAGILTHPKRIEDKEFAASDLVKSKTTFQADSNRPGVVHRLDRATSGILLLAKNPAEAEFIQAQFANRQTKKTYFALVEGTPKNLKARIDLPIERNPNQQSTFKVGANGKPSITDYEVVKTNGKYSLVKLNPKTGRTHQLRVHMQYIGHPIVGDLVYGNPKIKAPRMFLHAASLEIELKNGDKKCFEAPLPTEFEQFYEA